MRSSRTRMIFFFRSTGPTRTPMPTIRTGSLIPNDQDGTGVAPQPTGTTTPGTTTAVGRMASGPTTTSRLPRRQRRQPTRPTTTTPARDHQPSSWMQWLAPRLWSLSHDAPWPKPKLLLLNLDNPGVSIHLVSLGVLRARANLRQGQVPVLLRRQVQGFPEGQGPG